MRLFRPGFDVEPYTFRGDHLREIAFPLGGIGTGCVSLDGRGALRDWEIYNRPNKNSLIEKTFPILWVKPEGGEPQTRVVHGPRVRDFIGEGRGFWTYGHGRGFNHMDGLPGFSSVELKGTFPLARVEFFQPGFPLEVELAAFNPFIPLDVRSSSFPAACLVYRLRNVTDRPVDLTLAWNLMNLVGDGVSVPKGDKERARNEAIDGAGIRGIHFTNQRLEEKHPQNGDAALTTTWIETTTLTRWPSGEWFDDVQAFWSDFAETGLFTITPEHTNRAPGALGCIAHLAPGEEAEIPFLISWRFPNANKYWGEDDAAKSHAWTPYYATEWLSSIAVAEEFFGRYDELSERTLAFEESFFSSTLPPEVIQSVSATASILHSPTVIRLENGEFWAWEGCSPSDGCCSGTCSHVWNYSVAHAHLFPEMQWSMRKTDYDTNFNCGPEGLKGALNFRVMIPLGASNPLWHAASDGQLGGVIQLYRDWRMSGDHDAMRELWPKAKRALEFAWSQWDRDRDGLVDGDAHNTYDINFQGPNPLTQFFYLGALRAGEEMARATGDDASANTYRELYERGRRQTETTLWNGEFFVQRFDCLGPTAPKYQHGEGCLSDQVFGQLCSSLAGLGDLVDPTLIETALRAIYAHNFLSPLADHVNLQRVYAVADEGGLILCSWPNGGRPAFPFVYSDEVWTGIEYQIASHLALVGMTEECLSILRAIRARYDGRRRNPWNEFECGSHYARAMASYGVWVALTGYDRDALNDRTSFQPRIATGDEFRAFFCEPRGWGIATIADGETKFEYRHRA